MTFNDNVQNNLKVFVVQIVDRSLGAREDFAVPGEFSVVSIPADGRKVCSEIDHCIAGQLLLPEGFRFLQDLLRRIQGAVGLLVTETPEGRHLGKTGYFRILGHNRHWILYPYEEEIQRSKLL